jgi:membrane fusion protein, heavy metal efflux system
MHAPLPLTTPRNFAAAAAALFVLSFPLAAGEAPLGLSAQQFSAARIAFTRATKVDAAATEAGQGGASLRLSGRIVVPNTALELVLSPAAGRVESLLVNPGQKVRAGQALARIHSAEIVSLQRELISARTRAGTARTRAERDEKLHDEGIIARNRLEESRAQLAEAEALLGEQVQLLRLAGMSENAVSRLHTAADITTLLTISARRAGSVLQQSTGPGESIAAGDPLFRLATLDALWAELQATRTQAAQIQAGDRVTIPGCSRAGSVIAAALQLDSQSQTTTVRAQLPGSSDCLTPNQYVEALITPKTTKAALVSVPASSLVQRQGTSYVFVRAAAGLQPVAVEVERRTADSAWISGAIKSGDEVASAGLAAIKGSWMGLGATAEAAGEQR